MNDLKTRCPRSFKIQKRNTNDFEEEVLIMALLSQWIITEELSFLFKVALATILIMKILRLKVEKSIRFIINYLILKQTPHILNIFPSKCG